MEENALRGRVLGRFKTLGAFAKAMGWSRRKTSEIVNKKQEATASDIDKMCEVLEVAVPEDFRILFLN